MPSPLAYQRPPAATTTTKATHRPSSFDDEFDSLADLSLSHAHRHIYPSSSSSRRRLAAQAHATTAPPDWGPEIIASPSEMSRLGRERIESQRPISHRYNHALDGSMALTDDWTLESHQAPLNPGRQHHDDDGDGDDSIWAHDSYIPGVGRGLKNSSAHGAHTHHHRAGVSSSALRELNMAVHHQHPSPATAERHSRMRQGLDPPPPQIHIQRGASPSSSETSSSSSSSDSESDATLPRRAGARGGDSVSTGNHADLAATPAGMSEKGRSNSRPALARKTLEELDRADERMVRMMMGLLPKEQQASIIASQSVSNKRAPASPSPAPLSRKTAATTAAANEGASQASGFQDLAKTLGRELNDVAAQASSPRNAHGDQARRPPSDENASNGSGYGPGEAAVPTQRSPGPNDEEDSGETLVDGSERAPWMRLPSGVAMGRGAPPKGVSLPEDLTGLTSALASPVKARLGVQHRPIQPSALGADGSKARERRQELGALGAYIKTMEGRLEETKDRLEEVERSARDWRREMVGLRDELSSRREGMSSSPGPEMEAMRAGGPRGNDVGVGQSPRKKARQPAHDVHDAEVEQEHRRRVREMQLHIARLHEDLELHQRVMRELQEDEVDGGRRKRSKGKAEGSRSIDQCHGEELKTLNKQMAKIVRELERIRAHLAFHDAALRQAEADVEGWTSEGGQARSWRAGQRSTGALNRHPAEASSEGEEEEVEDDQDLTRSDSHYRPHIHASSRRGHADRDDKEDRHATIQARSLRSRTLRDASSPEKAESPFARRLRLTSQRWRQGRLESANQQEGRGAVAPPHAMSDGVLASSAHRSRASTPPLVTRNKGTTDAKQARVDQDFDPDQTARPAPAAAQRMPMPDTDGADASSSSSDEDDEDELARAEARAERTMELIDPALRVRDRERGQARQRTRRDVASQAGPAHEWVSAGVGTSSPPLVGGGPPKAGFGVSWKDADVETVAPTTTDRRLDALHHDEETCTVCSEAHRSARRKVARAARVREEMRRSQDQILGVEEAGMREERWFLEMLEIAQRRRSRKQDAEAGGKGKVKARSATTTFKGGEEDDEREWSLPSSARAKVELLISASLDEFYHSRLLYSELADELKKVEPSMSRVRRRILAQHVVEAVEALEAKAERIELLVTLLDDDDDDEAPALTRVRQAEEEEEGRREEVARTMLEMNEVRRRNLHLALPKTSRHGAAVASTKATRMPKPTTRAHSPPQMDGGRRR